MISIKQKFKFITIGAWAAIGAWHHKLKHRFIKGNIQLFFCINWWFVIWRTIDFHSRKRKQILHYWKSDNTAEVDFLIQKDSHVIPVECKAGNPMKNDNIKSWFGEKLWKEYLKIKYLETCYLQLYSEWSIRYYLM